MFIRVKGAESGELQCVLHSQVMDSNRPGMATPVTPGLSKGALTELRRDQELLGNAKGAFCA
jgi:hypothetical protein